jgi:hypothetical protein
VRVSAFVTVQSFATFAVAAAVLKTLWELARALLGPWADSYWTAFGLCLAYGAWQFALGVSAPRSRGLALVSAAVVAIANAGILAAALIGLTETSDR